MTSEETTAIKPSRKLCSCVKDLTSARIIKDVYVDKVFKFFYDNDYEEFLQQEHKKTHIYPPRLISQMSAEYLETAKKRTLCLTPHATFKEERKYEQLKGLSRLFFFDIDMTADKRRSPIRERADLVEDISKYILTAGECSALSKYILFLKNSSSINGIHIFMQYSVEMEKDILDSSNIKARFGQYYNVFAQQMAGALSAYRGVIQIDSACKDLPRLCVMNYPFCSYYNEDALEINYVLPNEPPAPTPALRQRQWTPARDEIEKRIYAAEGVSNLAEYIMKVANISDCHDKGNEIVMTCPFKEHNDTKPSFFVNKHNNVYYCHGNCGALYPQGGLLKFLQAYYNLVRIQDVGAYIRKEYNT